MIQLRPPSLSKTWETYFSGDPSFVQAPPKPKDDASEEDKSAYEDYQAKLQSARETGDWSALTLPDGKPTKFVLDQVDRTIWREILDRGSLDEENQRRLGTMTVMALLFRLAIKNVVGSDLDCKHVPDPKWVGWSLAPALVVDVLDEIDSRIVTEIGGIIWMKLAGLSKK